MDPIKEFLTSERDQYRRRVEGSETVTRDSFPFARTIVFSRLFKNKRFILMDENGRLILEIYDRNDVRTHTKSGKKSIFKYLRKNLTEHEMLKVERNIVEIS